MAGRLEGKVALITGGASGQGRAAAIMFASEGAKVVLSDVNEEGGTQTRHLVTENGGQAVFTAADVSVEADARAMVEAALATYGALHVLYNNAGTVGIGVDARVTRLSVESWDFILNVNLRGIFLSSKYGIPALIDAGGGSVINTASIAGLVGSPYAGHAYTASKGGVIALTRGMAMTYARDKVRVNAICPGGVETPMTAQVRENPESREQFIAAHPIGRLGTAEDIASMAVYLASDESAITTGQVLSVDSGVTVV